MQIDGREPVPPTPLQYQRLTMPTREKGNGHSGNGHNGHNGNGHNSGAITNGGSLNGNGHNAGEVASGGFLSDPLTALQLLTLENTAKLPRVQPQRLNPGIPVHRNGHSNGVAHGSEFSANPLPFSSMLESASPAGWPVNSIPWQLEWWGDQATTRLSVVKAPARRRSFLREFPHLIGYMVGAATIFSLYLVIPLIILLDAVLPASLNRLMIAFGILALGELVICLILVKTTPRRKAKKGNRLVQL